MEWKILILKKQWKFSEFIILITKNWKWKEFQKSYTDNRGCFENLEDEKFNPWRENHYLTHDYSAKENT